MVRFSVVVPAYNAQDTLAETLQAVLAQTYADWECVVVDDGSTDDTQAVARRFADADPRFTLVSQENRGTGGAYNAGARAAMGEWIAICSADDILLPSHLATMAQAIEDSPGYDIYSCNGYYWAPDGGSTLVYAGARDAETRPWSLEDVLRASFFSVGACYRRELHGEVGGYREDVFGEDYDFWLRTMSRGARHLYVDTPLAMHRRSDTQKSASLVRAYESDISSIAAVLASGHLEPAQADAARAAIRHRRRLLFGLTKVGGALTRIARIVRAPRRGTTR